MTTPTLAEHLVTLAAIEADHAATPAQRLARRVTAAIEREPEADPTVAEQLRAVLEGAA